MDFNVFCVYVNLSSKFEIQGPGLKVKVDMTNISYHVRSTLLTWKFECLQ